MVCARSAAQRASHWASASGLSCFSLCMKQCLVAPHVDGFNLPLTFHCLTGQSGNIQQTSWLQLFLNSPTQPRLLPFIGVKFPQHKHFLLSESVLICCRHTLIFLSTAGNSPLLEELRAHTSKHLHSRYFLSVLTPTKNLWELNP